MANNYPSPCEKCDKTYRCQGCDDWKIRYLYRQKQINAYAENRRKPKPIPDNKFRYEHPDLVRMYMKKSPCDGCKLEKDCDIPCAAYIHWYDSRMRFIRGRHGL